jgi:hypothetical protein
MFKPTLCEFRSEWGHDCLNPPIEGAPAAICADHAAKITAFVMARAGSLKQIEAERFPAYPYPGRVRCVYYIRFAERVKIGTTTDLYGRMSVLPHDELLAIEPGDHAQEHLRHLQFRAIRTTGEWFIPNSELRVHVTQIRQVHGNPAEAWNRWKKQRIAA